MPGGISPGRNNSPRRRLNDAEAALEPLVQDGPWELQWRWKPLVSEGQEAVQATGNRLTPRWKLERRKDGGPAGRRSEVRASTSANSARS